METSENNQVVAKQDQLITPIGNPTESLVVDKNNPLTMQRLKNAGYRVTSIHFRKIKTMHFISVAGGKMYLDVPVEMPMFEIRRRDLRSLLLPHGGYTTVYLKKDHKVIIGEALCSDKDVFNNKLGIKKALCDAWAKMQAAESKPAVGNPPAT